MKIFYKCLSVAILVTLFLGACKKDQHPAVIYITGTDVNPASTLSAQNGVASSIAVSVTSSALAPADITANLNAAPQLVGAYNAANGQNYLPVPDTDYTLAGNTVIIKAGTDVSNSLTLTIKSISDFKTGASYMIPVTISGSSDSFPVLGACRTIYYIIRPIISQTVASLANNYFTVNLTTNNTALKNMSAFTMEARVLVNSFQSGSPFISSVMGVEEYALMRFGDVTIKPDQLEKAGGNAVVAPQEFATGVWYSLAIVHNGSTTAIYVNGVLAISLSDPTVYDFTTITNAFYIGASGGAGSRELNGLISECRLWSVARTPSQLADGACGVDPASPGLEAYWKFNDGTGRIAADLTGHGHTATASGNVSWVPNVKCGN